MKKLCLILVLAAVGFTAWSVFNRKEAKTKGTAGTHRVQTDPKADADVLRRAESLRQALQQAANSANTNQVRK